MKLCYVSADNSSGSSSVIRLSAMKASGVNTFESSGGICSTTHLTGSYRVGPGYIEIFWDDHKEVRKTFTDSVITEKTHYEKGFTLKLYWNAWIRGWVDSNQLAHISKYDKKAHCKVNIKKGFRGCSIDCSAAYKDNKDDYYDDFQGHYSYYCNNCADDF